jgi:BirA family biotin operon repressor/biotin-[acetyl-CoA-carboxylase] ligase
VRRIVAVIDWSAAADARRRVGSAVEAHAAIGSTNDRARELLATGADGVAVVAELQTAGRGRRGRRWQSPSGVNLTVSVGLRPRLPASRAGLLGIATALAVRDACAAAAELMIKWPNDVVDAGGLKVAGLLLETTLVDDRVGQAVLGIGINVNWRRADMPAEVAATATSLAESAGREIDRVQLLAALLSSLDAELAALEDGQTPVTRFAASSWLDGRHVEVNLGQREVAGRVAGIDRDGSLLLDTQAGRLALNVGEVVRVRPRLAESA